MIDLRSALAARLQILPNLPDVAWENVAYTPVIGTPYLKPWLLPAEPRQATLGTDGLNEERGVYQVSCFYPTGAGTKDIMTMAEAIRTHFKRGTVLSYNGQKLTVVKSYFSAMQQETDWLHLPINIVFRAFTAN